MTKCYNIWSDYENSKVIRKRIKECKDAINSYSAIIMLQKQGYDVSLNPCKEKLISLSEQLDSYFPKESNDICDQVWIDYKSFYFEDGNLVEEDISQDEVTKKILSLLKKKISFVATNLPKIKLVKGKDKYGEKIEEEVIIEAFSEISLSGQKVILDNYYQFKRLVNILLND